MEDWGSPSAGDVVSSDIRAKLTPPNPAPGQSAVLMTEAGPLTGVVRADMTFVLDEPN